MSANGKGKYVKDYVAPNILLTLSQMNCSKETVKIVTAKTHEHQKKQVCGKKQNEEKNRKQNSQKKTNFICAKNVEKNLKMSMKVTNSKVLASSYNSDAKMERVRQWIDGEIKREGTKGTITLIECWGWYTLIKNYLFLLVKQLPGWWFQSTQWPASQPNTHPAFAFVMIFLQRKKETQMTDAIRFEEERRKTQQVFWRVFWIIEKAREYLGENHFNFSSSNYFKELSLENKEKGDEEEGDEEKGKKGEEKKEEEEEEEEEEEIDEEEKEGKEEVKEMWKFVFWNKLLFS